MLAFVACGLGMIRMPGQAPVLGGAPQVATVVATGAQALAQAARHLPVAAIVPNLLPAVAMAAAGGAPAAAGALPLPPAFAAGAGVAIGGADSSTTFHDPAATPRADEFEFSITISALPSGDIPPIWLDYFFRWLQAACLLGICSLERGKKDDNLHLQAAIRMKCDSQPDDNYCKRMVRQIKKVLIGDTNNKISFKLFSPGQFMELMVGYCLKDQGKPHFATFSQNIPESFKERAKAAWNAIRRSYEDSFVVLCRKNFFQQVNLETCPIPPFWT